MNIWLIQTSEALPIDLYARKLRTSLLADTLVNRGHKVTWWASSFNHLKKEWYFQDDVDIRLSNQLLIKVLHGIGYKKNTSLFRLIDHRILSWKFRRFARAEKKPDLIVCSLPSYDLAWQAMRYANLINIPLVIDIRDQWPDNFLDIFPKRLKKLGRILLAHEFNLVREALVGSAALISITDSLLEWGLNYCGHAVRDNDRVFHLGFSRGVVTEAEQITDKFKSFSNDFPNFFVVTFIGTFGKYHDPSIVIECARRLVNHDIVFVLGGAGELDVELRNSATGLKNIVFVGWLNANETIRLLRLSDVGVCSAGVSGNKKFFPNKVFSYWAEGLPVASAFSGELFNVIDTNDVGFNYDSLNELEAGILNLMYNRERYNHQSNNARALFDSTYDANIIYENYANHLESIVGSYK